MRPDFIPSDVFRKHIKPHQMNSLFTIDSILAASFINRCIRNNTPINGKKHNSIMHYRPLDVIARARALCLDIQPPKAYALYKSIDDLEAEKTLLEQQVSGLKHKLAFDAASSRLTGATLLNEAEIVSARMPIPDMSGIYFLIKEDKVVYVGQSVKVFSRIASHYGNKDFDSIAYIPCSESNLNILESLYIHTLRPPLNGRWVNGKGMTAPIRLDALLSAPSQPKE